MDSKYILQVYRGHPGHQYWEEFEVDLIPMANVISSLNGFPPKSGQSSRNKSRACRLGRRLFGGGMRSCSMLINGYPRQACTALIEPIIEQTGSRTVKLAPLTKFPLVRDLIVDRSIMFENLKKVHAWIDVDSTHDRGPGPKISPGKQKIMYSLSTCMTCGCCSEACPAGECTFKVYGTGTLFHKYVSLMLILWVKCRNLCV